MELKAARGGTLRFIHAADLHLDSAFRALGPGQASRLRQERRETLFRLADYVNSQDVRLVLLAGDVFDGGGYRETREALAEALGRMEAWVFVAPGNHDFWGPGSPWLTDAWPENVHIFQERAMRGIELPDWGVTVHGAAFTGPEQSESLLAGFSAPRDGGVHIGLLHGETDPSEARYNPIRREEIAASGLDYLALGHIHKRREPWRVGKTLCAWPGCLEGRGFDETGEKGFYQGTVDHGAVTEPAFVPFARRRYEVLEADVTGTSPRAAVEAALPPDTERDLYRILLTGETGEAGVRALETALAERFYALEIQDHTRLAEDVWARAGEDSLRGLFLRDLRARWESAGSEAERETVTLAARFGLAALDRRDLG